MVNMKLSVINDPQYNGRVVFDRLVITPNSARRIKSFATAAGLDFRMGVDPLAIPGCTVWAEVSHREYQGEPQAEIKKYRAGR